jgi:hypothetical protein
VSLTDDLEASARDDDLRTALDNALRKLERAKAKTEDLVDAVYRAAKDAAISITIPPIPPRPKVASGPGKPEVAICILADWQTGKVTPAYNSDIAEERVARYAEKAVELIRLERQKHPVEEARIYLLGDLVEGEEIFPGQAHRIDASLYSQMFRTAAMLAGVVRRVKAEVAFLRVVGAIGNHGAMGGPIRRNYHPETNFDAMVYNIARMLVGEDPGIEWPETLVAGERAWYATDEVFGKRWFLFHGDQVKSASFGIPWYGFNKRLLGWATSVAPFDYSVSGHWHVPVRMNVNAITHWGAGSTESANTFAQEFLASGGQRPSQWLLFAGDRGVTSEWCVYLDD